MPNPATMPRRWITVIDRIDRPKVVTKRKHAFVVGWVGVSILLGAYAVLSTVFWSIVLSQPYVLVVAEPPKFRADLTRLIDRSGSLCVLVEAGVWISNRFVVRYLSPLSGSTATIVLSRDNLPALSAYSMR
ncbi:MAG: hypothetical protein ACETVV_00610 [Nitrososphaeria archaeon]